MNKDVLYLTHILESIEKVEKYTTSGYAIFAQDSKTQDAVLRNLHTLAESATRLSDELQEGYPDIAWREIHAFRNVVVHDYLGLDIDEVWAIVMSDLPALKVSMQKILVETK